NDQKRVVNTLIRAADAANLMVPRRPWLDDLASVGDVADLPGEGDSQILLGLADVPERQQQNPSYFVPDRDGALLVLGTSGSGNSTVLSTIAAVAGMWLELGRRSVYGMDIASDALGVLEIFPHVGSVIDVDAADRIHRILRTLDAEIDRRPDFFG